MGRTSFGCLSVVLFWASALLNLNASGGSNPPATIPKGLIQHVVIIFQENRTPDNLFHGLPNADIANEGVNSHGQTIALAPIALANSYDLGHRHADFVLMYDNGKMDGADKVTASAEKNLVQQKGKKLLTPTGLLMERHYTSEHEEKRCEWR